MDVFEKISTIIITVGCGVTFLMAVEQVTGRNRNRTNYLSFSLLFCNSVIMLGTGLIANNLFFEHPWSSFFFMTSVYLVGPLNLIYYTALVYPEKPIPYRIRLHLVSPAAICISEILFQLQSSAQKKIDMQRIFMPDFLHPVPYAVIIGAMLVAAYLSYLVREHLMIWKDSRARNEIAIIVSANSLAIASVLLMAGGFLLGVRELYFWGGITMTLIHVFIFLGHNRYPEFFQMLKKEIRDTKYRNSMLKGMDTGLIHDRLLALMTGECLYRELDVDLKTISERLSITPHQLSQFLNEKLKTSFPNYINSFRVDEAKRLLVENPEQSIITVCFHTGFSSKTTFNKVFKKFTGMSPSEYRMEGGRNG